MSEDNLFKEIGIPKELKIPILIIVVIALSLFTSSKQLGFKILKHDIKQYLMSQDLGFSSYYSLTGKWNTNFSDIVKFTSINFFDFLK